MSIQPLQSLKKDKLRLISTMMNKDSIPPGMEGDSDPVEKSANKYRESVENSKIDMNNYLFSEPEKPEKDTERIKDLQQLSKVSALGQLLDAASGLITRNMKGREAVVNPANFDSLGFKSLEQLQALDTDYKNRLTRYDSEVRQTKDRNSQLKMSADRFNKGVDIELAKFDADQVLKKETQEALKKDKVAERNYQAGLRLISQGDLDSGYKFLNAAGLGDDEIEKLIGQDEGVNGTNGSKNEFTSSEINAIRAYHELKSTLKDGDYDPVTGEARSAKAKEIDALKEELGIKIYAPESVWKSKEEITSPKERAKAGNLRGRFSEDELRSGLGGKVDPIGKINFEDPNDIKKLQNYGKNMGIAISNAKDEEKIALLDQYFNDLVEAGYSEEEAERAIKLSLGYQEPVSQGGTNTAKPPVEVQPEKSEYKSPVDAFAEKYIKRTGSN